MENKEDLEKLAKEALYYLIKIGMTPEQFKEMCDKYEKKRCENE